MELKWLEDLLALLEEQSISRAAARRHVTQPAFDSRVQAGDDATILKRKHPGRILCRYGTIVANGGGQNRGIPSTGCDQIKDVHTRRHAKHLKYFRRLAAGIPGLVFIGPGAGKYCCEVRR